MAKKDKKNPLWFKLDRDKIKLQLKAIGEKFKRGRKSRRALTFLILVFLLIGAGIAIYTNDTTYESAEENGITFEVEEGIAEQENQQIKENDDDVELAVKRDDLKLNYNTIERKYEGENIEQEEGEGVVTEPVRAMEEPVEQGIELLQPVSGKLIQGPGWNYHPVFNDWRYQPGVELEGNPGDIVMAATSGQVVSIREDEYNGIMITIEHDNGWETQYGHLQRTSVSPGDVVGKGQEIGRLGSTGISDGNSLYFVLQNTEGAVDPTEYFE